MESLNFKVVEITRDNSEKSRIHVIFKCKCGETDTKQWEVIKRKKFQGCEKCFSSNKKNFDMRSENCRINNLEKNGSVYKTDEREYVYQGFEHYAIKELISRGIAEHDIFTEYDMLKNGIFPEFWNDRYKCFIEVKGDYYERIDRDVHEKCSWVQKSGYDIFVWVIERKGKVLQEYQPNK